MPYSASAAPDCGEFDQRRQLLAGLGVAQAFQHQRMARQLLVECVVNRGRRRRVLVARKPARVIVGDPQHGIVELVGPLQPHAGIFFLAREFEDHGRVQVLEQRIPFRPGQLVDVGDRRLGVAAAIGGPARQQRRDQVGDRPADRLIDVELRAGVFLQLQVTHADHQTSDPVGLVDGQDLVGEFYRLVDIAVGDRRNERAIEQFVVLRVGAKRRTVERRGRRGVALDAGMTGSQIAACGGQALHVADGGELRRIVRRMIRCLRRHRAGQRKHGEGECGNRPAIETKGKHHDLPSSRML